MMEWKQEDRLYLKYKIDNDSKTIIEHRERIENFDVETMSVESLKAVLEGIGKRHCKLDKSTSFKEWYFKEIVRNLVLEDILHHCCKEGYEMNKEAIRSNIENRNRIITNLKQNISSIKEQYTNKNKKLSIEIKELEELVLEF